MKIIQIIPAPIGLLAQFRNDDNSIEEDIVQLLALTSSGDIVGFSCCYGEGFNTPCEQASNFIGYTNNAPMDGQ